MSTTVQARRRAPREKVPAQQGKVADHRRYHYRDRAESINPR